MNIFWHGVDRVRTNDSGSFIWMSLIGTVHKFTKLLYDPPFEWGVMHANEIYRTIQSFILAKLCINPMRSVWKSFPLAAFSWQLCILSPMNHFPTCLMYIHWYRFAWNRVLDRLLKKQTHTHTHSRKNKLQSISAVKVYQWRYSFCVCLMFACDIILYKEEKKKETIICRYHQSYAWDDISLFFFFISVYLSLKFNSNLVKDTKICL